MIKMRPKTFRELSHISNYEDRFEYLRLDGLVGETTFGLDRWVNQQFYKSRDWRDLRHHIIVRDNGCDLGMPGYDIHHGLLIHHINPITVDDIKNKNPLILDPDNLITTTHDTHNAIHYGDASLLSQPLVERTRGDTKLW